MARETGGKFLLRLEDIDVERCRPDHEEQMLYDLEWLGIEWEGEPRRQSDHFKEYAEALDILKQDQLVYPAFMSRREIRLILEQWGSHWKCDPDGVPHYPGNERHWSADQQANESADRPNHALRLNMERAIERAGDELYWTELGEFPEDIAQEQVSDVRASPSDWGDVVLGRSDVPGSYHLCVVLDDALQGVTHVVRGVDLFHATSVHRVLQELLGLPVPQYFHHQLVKDNAGRKLSKRDKDTSLTYLRQAGCTASDIIKMVGLDPQ